MRMFCRSLALLVFSLFASLASASDGILEINQTCAAAGCFSGDSAGFPVTIFQSGSYRLTSNLFVGPGVNGIQIDANARPGVDIDLNGFSMSGPGTCVVSGSSVGCSGLTSNAGVSVRVAAKIHGGRIGGFGNGVAFSLLGSDQLVLADLEIYDSYSAVFRESFPADNYALAIERVKIARATGRCIDLAGTFILPGAGTLELRDARISYCGGAGVNTGAFASLQMAHSSISSTGAAGVDAGDASTIEGTTVQGAAGDGIRCGRGCQIRDNVVTGNGGFGIYASFLSHVVDNQLDLNGGTAIWVEDGSTISRNKVGAATFEGQNNGISCSSGCSVFGNAVRNSLQPLSVGAGSRYGTNVFSLYPGSAVSGSGISAGDNLCEGVSC